MKKKQLFTVLLLSVGALSCGLAHSSNSTLELNATPKGVVYKEVKFLRTNNDKAVSGYTGTEFNVTTDGFKVNVKNANNNNKGWDYIKMGSKNSAVPSATITTPIIDKAITGVALNVDNVTTSAVEFIKLKAGTSANTLSDVGTFTIGKGIQEVLIKDPVANQIYQIEASLKKASSNGPLQLSGVKYYAESSVPVVALTNVNKVNSINEVLKLKANASGFAADASLTYNWTCEPANVIEKVNADSKTAEESFKLKAKGDAIITVKVDDGVLAADAQPTATMNLKVIDPLEGTVSVTELLDSETIKENDKVKLVGVVVGKNGNNTYIADPINGRAISAYKINQRNDINVGNEVIIDGKVGFHNGEKQIASGSNLFKVLAETKTIDVKPTSISRIALKSNYEYVNLVGLSFSEIVDIPEGGNKQQINKKVIFTDGVDEIYVFIKHYQVNERLTDEMVKRLENSKTNGQIINLKGLTNAAGADGLRSLQSLDTMEIAYAAPTAKDLATIFANNLVALTDADCAAKDVKAETWAAVKAKWTNLSNEAKELFKAATAKEDGTLLEDGAARYDAVLTAHPALENFAERTLVAASGNISLNNSNGSTIIIVSVSVLTVALLGAAVLLMKRRKVNE